MESESEKTSEPEREIADIEDSNDEINKKIEIETTSTNPKREDRKQPPKACDEKPYIVKLFKSLMNPQESRESAKDKKK